MARVHLDRSIHPAILRERGIHPMDRGGTTIWWTKKPNEQRDRKRTPSPQRLRPHERMRELMRLWENMKPCQKSFFYTTRDHVTGHRGFDLFLYLCGRGNEGINPDCYKIKCWCVIPYDQWNNRIHVHGTFTLKWGKRLKHTYSQSRLLYDCSSVPTTCWNPFWGAARYELIPKTTWFIDDDGKLVTRPWQPGDREEDVAHDKRMWATYYNLNVKWFTHRPPTGKPTGLSVGISEPILMWLPFQVCREPLGFPCIDQWDQQYVSYSGGGCGGAINSANDYQGGSVNIWTGGTRFSLCPHENIKLQICYSNNDLKWEIEHTGMPPFWRVSIAGVPVGRAGTGQGPRVTERGSIITPGSLGAVTDRTPYVRWDYSKHEWEKRKITKVTAPCKEIWRDTFMPSWRTPGADRGERVAEIQYKCEFPEPIYVNRRKGTPELMLTATASERPDWWGDHTPWLGVPYGRVSFDPGFFPSWYWLLDRMGPHLQPGVTKYCLPYGGHYTGMLKSFILRASHSYSPMWYRGSFKGSAGSVTALLLK